MTTPNITHKDATTANDQIRSILSKTSDLFSPDVLSNGEVFCCDNCKSNYIVNPVRIKRVGNPRRKAVPRRVYDTEQRKFLILCNSCGLKLKRKPQKNKSSLVVGDEKQKYLEESVSFGKRLARIKEMPELEKFYCPSFSKQGCGCLQKYLSANGDEDEIHSRVMHLAELHQKAKELGKQKLSKSIKNSKDKMVQRKQKAGLGSGHKKTKEFEDYVLLNRNYLRKELFLCEKATQKVLSYSNNFVHKRLKTEPERRARVERVKGKGARGLLPALETFSSLQCCGEWCTMLALTHSTLLQQWRDGCRQGQRQTRLVLADMLTPSAACRSNCSNFISWVTGCSASTIGAVREHMAKTGGLREPPEHGLKRWHKERLRLKEAVPSDSVLTSGKLSQSSKTGKQLDEDELQNLPPEEAVFQLEVRRQKIIACRKELALQQQQLEEQQQWYEQLIYQSSTASVSGSDETDRIYHTLEPANDDVKKIPASVIVSSKSFLSDINVRNAPVEDSAIDMTLKNPERSDDLTRGLGGSTIISHNSVLTDFDREVTLMTSGVEELRSVPKDDLIDGGLALTSVETDAGDLPGRFSPTSSGLFFLPDNCFVVLPN